MSYFFKNIKNQITLTFTAIILISSSITTLFTSVSFRIKLEKSIQNKLKSDLAFERELIDMKYPGDWSVKENELYKGEVLMNNNFEIVDKIKEISGNTATIFLGDTRITTNVKKADGERAIGTKVSKIVEETVLKQHGTYIGVADVVGIINQTAYEPIRNKHGEVIGILYVGIPNTTYEYLIYEFILLMVIISVIILIIGGAIMFVVVNRKISPLKDLTDATEKIAKGSLNFDYPDKHSNDEIGVLSNSIHTMKDQIRSVIAKMKQITIKNNEIVTDLSNYSINLSYAAGMQIAQAKEFHTTFSELSKSSKKMNENIESSTDSTKNVSNIILEFLESFKGIAKITHQLNNLVSQITTSIQSSEKEIHDISSAIYSIKESTGRVTEFIGIITEISDRTNLLSLNASIEAARAGESGRGFAVVASEITKLADKTLLSVKDIEAIIHASSRSIQTGIERVNITLDSIHSVVKNFDDINNYTNEIRTKFEEQISTTNVITENLDNINSYSNEIKNSLSIQNNFLSEVSYNAENLTQNAEDLNNQAQSLKDMSEGLNLTNNSIQELVNNFVI